MNAVFEAAKAGGAVDTSVGFPKSREEMYEFYGFIRNQTRDAASVEGRGRARVARGLHVQGRAQAGTRRASATRSAPPRRARPPQHHAGDRHAVRRTGRARALREHPDRFFAGISVDPNEGMEAVRKIDRMRRGVRPQVRAARSPPACTRRSRSTTRSSIPIYMKCVELDIPFCVDDRRARTADPVRAAGRRAPRRGVLVLPRAEVRDPARMRAVDRPRGEAACSSGRTSTTRPPRSRRSTTRRTSSTSRTRAAPTRSSVSGYFPAGLTYDRIFSELPDVPFRDHVWPKFLRENAKRVFKLAD